MGPAANGGQPERWFVAASLLLILPALAFRVLGLDHLPGINGDEAYYGANILALLGGQPFTLLTASGLPINVFYSGWLLLFHGIGLEPAPEVLRWPAAISGFITLVLAYPLLARVFDRTTALATTLLLACLPIAIAYSRFGWDQCQAPLAGLLCLYFALRREPRAAGLAYILACYVHPLNIFQGPIMLGPVAFERLVAWHESIPAEERQRRVKGGLEVLAGVVLAIIAAFMLVVAALLVFAGDSPLAGRLEQQAPRYLDRLVNPLRWVELALLYGDLLSGLTIYRYVAGEVPEAWVVGERLAFWVIVLPVLYLGTRRLIERRDYQALGLLIGLVISVIGFCFLGGPLVISPGHERYAMWLVLPSCLVLVLLGRQLGDSRRAQRLQALGLLLVCSLLLTSFYMRYFVALRTTGSTAHRTFRTGPVEPKEAALALILQQADGQPASILAEDYWCYMPLRYLADRHPDLRVVNLEFQGEGETDTRRRFLVGFAGGPCDRWLSQHAPHLPRQETRDFAGQSVLYVWDLGTTPELVPGLVAVARR